MKNKSNLQLMFEHLYRYYGPLHWWPGDSVLEIIVGAILTQNTNWENAKQAILKMKEKKLLELRMLVKISEQELAQVIKPSGYYNLKAKRLKNIIHFIDQKYDGSLVKMFNISWKVLRTELLSIKGIGDETADSILLYAGKKPVFVVDAYTKRIFQRHGLISNNDQYQQIQKICMKALPVDYILYNEFHAQIVMVGKEYCKQKKPRCHECPLHDF